MVNVPNFSLRRRKVRPITFVPAEQVFKPQRMVRMTKDVNGYVAPGDRRKWELSYGREYAIDEDKAREFVIKGYCVPVDWEVVASEDERAEILSNVTIIGLGG
jgi:hypothetical protein